MKSLADDSQLWKAEYYSRFVRPRASRIPGLRGLDTSAKALHYSSKLSRWLGDEHLIRGGKKTNWKRQYKLRHNWSTGSCDVSQTQVAEKASIPPLLVRLHENMVFTANATDGLRVWSLNGEPVLLATIPFFVKNESREPFASPASPTSLAEDVSNSNLDEIGIAIGFADGRFGIYTFDKRGPALALQYMHAPSSIGTSTVSAIAYASPYVLTMTEAQLLSLYTFPRQNSCPPLRSRSAVDAPRLLSSLKSYTAWPPLSLSIRATSISVFASIAYAMPTYLGGWSVGLQEMLLTAEGNVIESRLASAETQGFHPILISNEASSSPSRSPRTRTPPLQRQTQIETSAYSSKPTTLSYTHPYLLAAHADNTLTLYMVISNADNLMVGPGRRLWGHTSSVASAHVGDRGKAVSVSSRGNELRVWELEASTVPQTSKNSTGIRRDADKSIRVHPEPKAHGSHEASQQGTKPKVPHQDEDMTITKGWVAFDEEKVVVLQEEQMGAQALVMYDFT